MRRAKVKPNSAQLVAGLWKLAVAPGGYLCRGEDRRRVRRLL